MDRIRLGDACEILNGYAFRSENYVESGIRVIRISNVQKGYIEDNTPAYYPSDSNGLDRFMLEEGDLLMSLTGNVGRVAILEKKFLPAALNQRVACLRLKSDKLSKRYLFHILNSDFFEQQCILSSKGVAQKNMSTEWLKDFEIPLYPTSKQEEITDILDKTHNVIACRIQELQKLDELVKARFVELFGDLERTTTIARYISELRGGKSLAGTEPCKNKVLKTGAATFGWFDHEQYKYLPADYEPLPEHKVETGDVIISRMNTPELVGACSYVFDAPDDMYYPDRLWKAVLKENTNPIFLWQLLWDRDIRKAIKESSGGTSGTMHNISKTNLLAIKCMDAPIELQNEYAEFVKQTDKSKVVVQEALDEAQLLFDSLMQNYFSR